MSFFKAYDMRGTFGIDFCIDTVYRVGKVLPSVVGGSRYLVGRDCRTTSSDIRDALVQGLTDAGAEVCDIGLCTTPMVYFFTAEGDYDGSVMITASHNPASDNGLKVSRRSALPVGYADGLSNVESIVGEMGDVFFRRGESIARTDGVRQDLVEKYVAWMRKANPLLDEINRELDFAVDCSGGMASILARRLFPSARILNGELDGTFSRHSPNPLKPEAREDAAAIAVGQSLDCAIIFDGDADRCMFVDECGRFVQPDYLIPAVASATASGGKIIHDVRTSRGATEELSRLGFEPVMVPVGHAFAKPILRKVGAVCGGELAGHYYFSEFHGCDSGVLAAIRILSSILLAKRKGISFSSMVSPVVSRYVNSGELNFKVEDKDAAISRVLAAAKSSLPEVLSSSYIDGTRLEYAQGWINIRKSNTEPYLRVIAECKSQEDLQNWLAVIREAIGV